MYIIVRTLREHTHARMHAHTHTHTHTQITKYNLWTDNGPQTTGV